MREAKQERLSGSKRIEMGSEERYSFEELKTVVLDFYKEKRKEHVLGCVDCIGALAEKWLPDSREELLRAAYLHDITKRFSGPSQLIICDKLGIPLTEDDRLSPPVLHAISGAYFSKAFFHESDFVCNAIRWHTTGRAEMSLPEILLFLSDMIEPTRSYPELKEIQDAVSLNPYYGLEVALKRSLEFIASKGQRIHSATEEAYSWICKYNRERG